ETVLDALADALRLDDAERAHLFDLARASQPASRKARRATTSNVRPTLQWMLDAMTSAAAFASNGHLDVLCANQLGRALYAPMFRDGPESANWGTLRLPEPRRARDLHRLGPCSEGDRCAPAPASRRQPARPCTH